MFRLLRRRVCLAARRVEVARESPGQRGWRAIVLPPTAEGRPPHTGRKFRNGRKLTLEFFCVIFIYNRVEQSGRAQFGDTFAFLKKKRIERKKRTRNLGILWLKR